MEKTAPEKQYMLVNIAEELVRRKAKEMMAAYDMCQCHKCYLDVCAIILDTLEPRYVTTEKGALLSLLETTDYQFKTDLTVLVLQAMKQVKANPRH